MAYKTNLLSLLNEAQGTAQRQQVSQEIIANIDHIQREVTDFKIKVPLMGGFNAGKSSLINHFLQNPLLPTDITPETTIPAEVKYGESPKIIAHTKDGALEPFPIDEIKKITPDKYLYIEVFQNRDMLKQLENVVIVDMPGLDSGIEAHNQAVLNYVEEGVFYIIVADVDHGLKDSVLTFLKELDLYSIDFAVIITKTDHKHQEEVTEVVENAKRIVQGITGREVFVGSTSTENNAIDDFTYILSHLDLEALIKNKFQFSSKEQIGKIIRELEIKLNYDKANTVEIEEKIKNIEKQIASIEHQLEEEKQKIDHQFGTSTLQSILNDVGNALHSNMYTLVPAAKSGQDGFSRAVNDIIRPILTTSVHEHVSIVLNQSFENISTKLHNVDESLYTLQSTLTATEKTLKTVSEVIKNPKVRTILAGLSLFTTVIAPWLELIIIFLPEIVKLFVNEDEKIRNQIESQAIPQIIEKLRPQIVSSLSQVNDEFIRKVSAEIQENKAELINSLQQVIEEKNIAKEEFDQIQRLRKQDLDKLNNLLQQI